MKLSAHFSIEEAEHSNTAQAKGISNRLANREHLISAVHTSIYLLEPIRAGFGVPFAPNSWYRSQELNDAIAGSSNTSDHLKGRAADVEVPGVDNLDLAWWIAHHLDFDQVISEKYVAGQPTSGWVHASYRLGNNRKQLKTLTADGQWRDGLPEK